VRDKFSPSHPHPGRAPARGCKGNAWKRRAARGAATLACALFASTPSLAAEDPAVDLAWKTRVVGEAHGLRRDSIFDAGLPLTAFGRDRARAEGEARGRAGPVSLLLTATESAQEGERASGKLLANEAYVDFGKGENRITAGKKILSGDVGYGFRPIDVIQREARLQVLPPALEGVPNLSLEYFTAQTAYSIVIANPGNGRRGDPKDDGSLALRYYRRAGGADLHGIARYSDRFKLEAGGALSAVPHESLELHASFLMQRRGERQAPLAEPASSADLLAPDRAVQTVILNAPGKALGGFTWTAENGWSVMGEAWWDGTAPTAEDWKTLARQTKQRNALLFVPGVPAAAVTGSLAASTRLFQQPGLSRRNLLGRIAWTDPAGSGWTASLDAVRTLEDGGWVATAAAGWQGNRWRLDAGLRRYGGRPDSAYRLFPERGIAFLGASLAF